MSVKANGIQVFTSSDASAVVKGVDKVMLRWVGKGVTAGDQVVISDSLGNKVWETVAISTNVIDSFVLNLRRGLDLTLTTLTSGTLYIYPL
jgi:hypothetical protein